MILCPEQDWQAVVDHLQAAKHVLIVAHQSPDADTIGSQLALFDALQTMGLQVGMCNKDAVPRICRYLPHAELIQQLKYPALASVDTIVAVDAGSKARLGFPDDFFVGKTLINIDHHASNPMYGEVNVVNADYCATGAMIFDLIQHLNQPISKASAAAIYAAVLTDTASFHLDRVDAAVHKMVAELIEAGADPAVAAEEIYDKQPLARLNLLTRSLQTLVIEHEGRSAWMYVDQTMLDETQADLEDSEGFIDLARSVDGVEVVVFVRPESANRWKASFRGKMNRDVGAVAAKLHGGGHKYAAGCAVTGSLAEVYAKIHAVVDDVFSS
ncbi:MAG: DHH family phosphoesterase [Ghiorsea sp.]